MPRANWNDVPDATENKGYEPIPEGRYVVKVDNVIEKVTKNGDDMWALTLKVVGGDHGGAKIFDNITFSERGLSRCKLVAHRLGVNLDNGYDLQISDILDRKCEVDVLISDYVDRNGQPRKKNAIPFAGYYELPGGSLASAVAEKRKKATEKVQHDPEDEIPF